MIIGRMKVENPDKIQVTLTLSMPFEEWQQIADKLDSAWPNWCLASVIRSGLRDLEKVSYQEQEYHAP